MVVSESLRPLGKHDNYHVRGNYHVCGNYHILDRQNRSRAVEDAKKVVALDKSTLAQSAIAMLVDVYAAARWKVDRSPRKDHQPDPDLFVSRGGTSYAVELKATSDGRADRLVPLWSQACLQAGRAAREQDRPLAVVAAPRITLRAANQVLAFAAENAPEVAVGVVDLDGLRLFRGPDLEGLDAEAARPAAWPSETSGRASQPENLFSDLSQWMLKVLLAPELPETLLSAPRGRYRNASELALAANVSVMSAFRFVQQLGRDGYLHESAPYLNLVRREELFYRWQAWSTVKRVHEVPMQFLLRANLHVELGRLLESRRACLGLFAAAEALGLGFVEGVPPYVYVERLRREQLVNWKQVIPASQGEAPDFFLRQAPAPQSVFRGLVLAKDRPASDVLQVWLDVASHPARGAEQAEQIRRQVLASVLDGRQHG